MLKANPTHRPSPGHFIPAMTGVRALAAFMVFFSHYPLPAKRAGNYLSGFFSELYIGVTIFFVLSGFLITLRYADNFRYSFSGFFDYMRNRFARIYPMYFIFTSLTFIFYKIYPAFGNIDFQAHSGNNMEIYLFNITFLRGFFHDIAFSGIGQGWTLTVEECFYVLAPFIFLIRNRVPAFIQLVFLYSLGFLFVWLFENSGYPGFFESNKFMLIITFFGRCFEFYVGMKLAIWYKKNNKELSGSYFTYSGIVFLVLIVAILVLTKDRTAEYDLGLYSWPGLIINNFILPLVIAVFFTGLLRERTFIKGVLENKFMVLLGKSSYVFYLIHLGFISELLYAYVTHNYLLNFPLLVFLSVLIYRGLEAPLNNFIRTGSFKGKNLSGKIAQADRAI